MKIKKYIRNLVSFPNNISNVLSKISRIEIDSVSSTREVEVIKNDLNIIFRYMSGLELHPRMPERLIVSDYRDVSKDHLVRYSKACEYIKPTDVVLDFACGCGYGSSCVKINANPTKIFGCDIDLESVEFAKRFYGKQGIDFQCKNVVENSNFPKESFDTIISFETIEHVPNDISSQAILNFYDWLKLDGKIICSVPNEKLNPFESANNRYHFKHYTHQEFYVYLESAGFVDIEFVEESASELYDCPLGKEFDSIIAIAYKRS